MRVSRTSLADKPNICQSLSLEHLREEERSLSKCPPTLGQLWISPCSPRLPRRMENRSRCAPTGCLRFTHAPWPQNSVLATVAGPEVGENLLQEPVFGPDSTNTGRFGPVRYWPTWQDIGKARPKLAELGQLFAKCWSTLAKFVPKSPNVCRTWATLGQTLATSTKMWPKTVNVSAMLLNMGRILAPGATVRQLQSLPR